MAFRMAGLQRKKSGAYTARKSIPKDVRDGYQALYGRGWEELFSAPAHETPSRAKVLFSEWQAEIDNRIVSMRAKQRGKGVDLTQRQSQALAGEWYHWWVAIQMRTDLGEPSKWFQCADLMCAAVMDATPYWENDDPVFHQKDRGKEPAVREEVHPWLAEQAETAQFLASKGEVLTAAAMTAFLDEVLNLYIDACSLLERRAKGDYTPDPRPRSFPEYERQRTQPPSGRTCVQLYENYIRAVRIAPSTINRWRVVFHALDEHLAGRAIEAFSEDDAQRWAASLLNEERGARTVSSIWARGANTVFGWAQSQKLVRSNPFAKVTIRVPRRVRIRETPEFTDAEVRLILSAASAITDTTSPFKAACRWVPWLCAYSGARAGEITQLRGKDVERRDGFVAVKLTPEAGTIKNAKTRTVPLHAHIVEQGFLDYVASKGKGPLFYTPDTTAEEPSRDLTNPKRPRAVKTRERLAAWVRKLGVVDKESVQLTHGATRSSGKHSEPASRRRPGISSAATPARR
jgi:integrase